MSTSYEQLHVKLRSAADAASSALDPGDELNDLRQAAIHLHTVVEMLDEVDTDTPEPVDPNAVLSKATAIADKVLDKVLDLTNEANTELLALGNAVEDAMAAGYIGDDPLLEWYEGDIPKDGSSFD